MLATRLLSLIACTLLCMTAGCTTCCTPYDYDYPAYGGRWQRNDPTSGRVGSVFSNVSSQVVDEEDVGKQDDKGTSVLEGGSNVRQIFRRKPVPDE